MTHSLAGTKYSPNPAVSGPLAWASPPQQRSTEPPMSGTPAIHAGGSGRPSLITVRLQVIARATSSVKLEPSAIKGTKTNAATSNVVASAASALRPRSSLSIQTKTGQVAKEITNAHKSADTNGRSTTRQPTSSKTSRVTAAICSTRFALVIV